MTDLTPVREKEIRARYKHERHVVELLAALDAERARAEEARKLVAAYYAYHTEDGTEVCPCDVCEKARSYFHSLLRCLDAAGAALAVLEEPPA